MNRKKLERLRKSQLIELLELENEKRNVNGIRGKLDNLFKSQLIELLLLKNVKKESEKEIIIYRPTPAPTPRTKKSQP